MKVLNKSTAILAFIGICTTLQNCGSSTERKDESHPTSEVHAVETFQLRKDLLATSIQIPGELIAFQQVDLYAKVSSFVKKLYADIGAEVREGQLLATMEAPELNAQLAGAASKLKSQEAIYLASNANYDRMLETSKTPGTISQSELDFALAKQNSDLAQLEAAKSSRKEITDTKNYLEIRAPFKGVISARNVSTGAYVGPSGKGSELPLFTLVEQRKLRLVVSVPEAYTSFLNGTTVVRFTVKSLPDQSFTAKVSRQAGMLDTKLRAQRTEMDVINSELKLLPGMVAEVSIPLQREQAGFVVPNSAVLNSSQGIYLIKVVNKKAVWVPIKIGNKGADKTEIFGEIQSGDTIVKAADEEIRNESDLKNTTTVSF